MSYEDQLGRLASRIAEVEAGALRHREQVMNSLQDLLDRLHTLEREVAALPHNVTAPISSELDKLRAALANLKAYAERGKDDTPRAE